jgi:MFS family permease
MAIPMPGEDARDEKVEGQRVYVKVFWHTVPFLMLCYVISYLDRVNIAFAKLQMQQNRGFSETVFGLGAGIFFLGYFVFGLPSNLLMVKIGGRNWIGRIMIAWGLLSASFIFVRTPASYYMLRFLLGAAEAGFYPGAILYLTYWFPAHRRARIVALFVSAIPVAGIFGNPLSGWIMGASNGLLKMEGWQWMFLIEATPALVAGAAAFFVLDDDIAGATWLSAAEKAFLAAEIRADADAGVRRPKSVSGLLRNGYVWLMCLIYFAIVMGQYGLTFWIPTLVKTTGVKGMLHIGLLSAIPFVCAVVVMNLCGRSSDAMRERRWHVIVPAVAAALGFVVAATYPFNTAVSLVFLSLAAAGVLTCTALFWSLPTSLLSGTAAAAGIAVINSVGNLAGFLSPSLIGYLKDATHRNEYGMFALAAILLCGAVMVWTIPAKLVNR